MRRRLLLVLSDGKPRTATGLKNSARRTLDGTLKHQVALREGGLVATKENPADGHRFLYALAPGVQVRTTDSGRREIDFGPCVLRL